MIHYLFLGITVMGGAILFQWMSTDQIKSLALLFLFFTIQYIIITMIILNKDKNVADKLNEKLEKYQKEEE